MRIENDVVWHNRRYLYIHNKLSLFQFTEHSIMMVIALMIVYVIVLPLIAITINVDIHCFLRHSKILFQMTFLYLCFGPFFAEKKRDFWIISTIICSTFIKLKGYCTKSTFPLWNFKSKPIFLFPIVNIKCVLNFEII